MRNIYYNEETKKYTVNFLMGESRKGVDIFCDYMICEVDGVELYAEEEIPESEWHLDKYGNEVEDEECERERYELLKEEIIAQAEANDIDVSELDFWWD